MRADAGLTLAEMLVVLAIIGVMSGVAVLGVGAVDRTVGAEIEARRLAARLSLAADQASVDRRARVFAWTDEGWSVAPAGAATSAERHDLPDGLRLSVDSAGEAVSVMPDGVGQPFQAVVAGGVERWRVEFDGLQATAVAGASQ